ncbi:cytochrome c [Sphingomonas sp.]|uniref:cytochrome c n=1 Tax=Sphingomonas sp. TaxID=28214 RepID=UPI00333F761B
MRLAILILPALVIAGGGVAALARTAPAMAPAASLPASDLVQGRRAAFRLSGGILGNLKAAAARGDDLTKVAGQARALAGWARAIPSMFPAGSNVAPTEALPTVWTDRAGFAAKAADYAAAADTLADLAKAGDTAGFTAQLDVVGKTCAGCHAVYHVPPKG